MIIAFSELAEIREKHKAQKIVLGGGAFDILHQGHIDYLRDVKALGDILVIAIKSNAEVRSYKDENHPVQDENVRGAVMDAIRYVDFVIVAPEPEGDIPPRLVIARALKPDVLVTINDKWRAYESELKKQGTELKIVPIDKVNSTTSIIERIRSGGEG